MKIPFKKLLLVCCFLSLQHVFCQKNRILFHNATVHTGLGTVLKNTSVGIENNKIVFLQNIFSFKIDSTKWNKIIDLNEQALYPAFVSSNSTLGLTEIDAVRATLDFHDVGKMNPHIRTATTFNTDSKVLQTVLTNGILIVQATPKGNTISGSSSIFFSNGWNWEDALIKADDGIHVHWPNPIQFKKEQKKDNDLTQDENYLKECEELELFFKSAYHYSLQKKDQDLDLRFEAMKDLFNGNKKVYFHANHVRQLLDIIAFVKENHIKNPVFIGGYESYLCLDRIRDSEIPILLTRVHSLPSHDDEAIDLPYRLPYLLFKQGILFGLQNEGDMEAMNARNIPFLAGTAMAYGLPEEEAIKAISFNVCKIIGIDKDFGSIEIGKNATFFVSKGSALDMKTNQLSHILINGNFVKVENFQKELYNKYMEKYGLE
ncbi:MAG: amidohydrolase family protein [Flavobacteriia bacterium]|nr:amidohydrolase family protein [Flavobacteriia bacterium]